MVFVARAMYFGWCECKKKIVLSCPHHIVLWKCFRILSWKSDKFSSNIDYERWLKKTQQINHLEQRIGKCNKAQMIAMKIPATMWVCYITLKPIRLCIGNPRFWCDGINWFWIYFFSRFLADIKDLDWMAVEQCKL